MKAIALVIALAVVTVGCATPPPANLLGTEGRSPDQLATVVIESDQVKIIDVDGKALPGSGTTNFYVVPGPHRLAVVLHWCPGGLCTEYGSFAAKPRQACIDAKAGMSYRVRAGNVGPDWVPVVTEQQGSGDPKPIDARCS